MIEYMKKEDESNIKYIVRLTEAKSNGLIDIDYSTFFRMAFDIEISETEARKRFYGVRLIVSEIDKEKYESIGTEDIFEEIENKRREMVKERMRLSDHRSAYNKILREESRWQELKDIITDEVRNIQPYQSYKITEIPHSNNDLLIGLNDIHYGVMIDSYWNKYSPEIAKARLEKYLEEIAAIKKLHGSQNCHVLANGDLISGLIHYKIALANREDVVKQVMGVSELISWFLAELSKMFGEVYFSAVAGNHSRLSPNKDNSPKDERLDDLIPFYAKARLQYLSNVHIVDNKIDNTLSYINIRGKNYATVHGDYDTIKQVLRLVGMYDDIEIYAVFMGHLHHNSTDALHGYKVLMSGSLMGMDDYCIEKRIKGTPQQMVAVCTEKGVKCVYDVEFQ